MGKALDLTDRQFDRLRVIRQAESLRRPNGKLRRRWLCQCECGNLITVLGENLISGNTKSCGCYHRDLMREKLRTHGDTDARLYNIWCAIKRRCFNPSVPEYARYGGRGISMCSVWAESYEAFKAWAMQTGYDPNAPRGACTIDRIDNDGNYEPENCRWVSQREQMNNVSYNRHITYHDETHTVAEWSRLTGIPYATLLQRLTRYSMDVERAFSI